jgi:predicted DNA-binding transcriptional regulator YafY
MNRTDRLYAMVEELRARAPRPVSVATLAARFEVSTRTIERDLQALLEAGVPIWSERGRNGGYTLDPTVTLPPLNLTPAEAVAVSIALASLGPNPFADAGRSARQKLVAAMSAAGAEQALSLTERLRVAPTESGVDDALFKMLRTAVEDEQVIAIEYVDGHGAETSREVEAHGFYVGDGVWGLVGWCRLRNDGRVFRLDRIRNARLTGENNVERDFDNVLGWMPPEFQRPELRPG